MKYYQNVISFMFVSGNFGADYVATGVFVDEVNQLFDSVRHAPPGKKLLGQLSNDN
jgi:hypothetical protein